MGSRFPGQEHPVRTPGWSRAMKHCFSLSQETQGADSSVLRESCSPSTTMSGNMKQNFSQGLFSSSETQKRLTSRLSYDNKYRKKKFCEDQRQKFGYTHPLHLRDVRLIPGLLRVSHSHPRQWCPLWIYPPGPAGAEQAAQHSLRPAAESREGFVQQQD